MNDGGPADDFSKNDIVFCAVLRHYHKEGYILVLLGDITDDWECPDNNKIIRAHPEAINLRHAFRAEGRLVQVIGNHDKDRPYREAVVLKIGDNEIFCAHGFQGDWINDEGWKIAKWIVRYFWRTLQYFGLQDPTEYNFARHAMQAKKLKEWADNNRVCMFAHTHTMANERYYKNTGSWVGSVGNWVEFQGGVFKMGIGRGR